MSRLLPGCDPAWHEVLRADASAWAKCALVGWQPTDETLLELRNCSHCGSTLALERRGFVWCPGPGGPEGKPGHPVARGTVGLDADALGRSWCAPCQRAEELAATDYNDGLPAATESRDT